MSSDKDERWKLRILHIREELANIKEFVKDHTYDSLCDDVKTFYAVMRSVQIIGDAVKSVPDSVKTQYPAVPWREMARFRDRVVHGYDDIDVPLVWTIIQDNLPQAALEIAKIPVSEEDL
jgi:uncharacterized protein with HEPN domain